MKKYFWIGTIVATIVFAIIGFFAGFIAERHSSWWYFSLLYAVVAGILGLFFSFLYSVIYEKFPEIKTKMKEDHDELKRNFETLQFWKKIYGEGHPIARQILIKSFVEKSIEHIINGREAISQKEYVRLLRASSEVATEVIFATSLLTPQTWVTGTYNQDYKGYLSLQKRLKLERPKLSITRIFINKKDDFYKDPYFTEIKNAHKEANIKLGFYDQEEFCKHRSLHDCRDFVLFKDAFGPWILDAGSLNDSEVEKEKGALIQLVDSESVNSMYSDIITFISDVGVTWIED